MSKLKNRFAEINIRQIKDIYFSISENIYEPDSGKLIKIELEPLYSTNVSLNEIELVIRVCIYYEENDADLLVDIQVKNVFELPSLERYMEKGEVVLASEIIMVLLSVSLSHTRALLTRNLGQTLMSHIVLPVLDVHEMAEIFFPREMKTKEPKAVKIKKEAKAVKGKK